MFANAMNKLKEAMSEMIAQVRELAEMFQEMLISSRLTLLNCLKSLKAFLQQRRSLVPALRKLQHQVRR